MQYGTSLKPLPCRAIVQCRADRFLVPAEPPLSTPAQAGHPDYQGGEAAHPTQLESGILRNKWMVHGFGIKVKSIGLSTTISDPEQGTVRYRYLKKCLKIKCSLAKCQ